MRSTVPAKYFARTLLSLLLAACTFTTFSSEHADGAEHATSSNKTVTNVLAALPSQPSEDEVSVLDAETRTNKYPHLVKSGAMEGFQTALESARNLRRAKDLKRAETVLIQLLEGRAPDEIKRAALLELAPVMQEQHEFTKAQQLYSEFVRRYSQDPAVPEVLLRQAYLYRDMGVSVLALSKFYAVISSCLNLKLDELDYYQKLVLRAQAEIAETYFLEGKYVEASDYFSRLLRLESKELDRADALYKLARCYSALGQDSEAVANARMYLDKFADGADAAEARFLLARSLKKIGRTEEALKEIHQLLQSESGSSKSDPKQWVYWQQRAGNEIANQFYREGDFMSALQVYGLLAELNKSPDWQVPVWYQMGLIFENLKQPQKASETYQKIIAHAKEALEKIPNPALKQIADMAAWRNQLLNWEEKAQAANRELQGPKPESPL